MDDYNRKTIIAMKDAYKQAEGLSVNNMGKISWVGRGLRTKKKTTTGRQ